MSDLSAGHLFISLLVFQLGHRLKNFVGKQLETNTCLSPSREPWRAPPAPAPRCLRAAHTQTLGVRERGLRFGPQQPLPLGVHTEGLPAVPVPLVGAVPAVPVTLQAGLVPLTVSDACNRETDTMLDGRWRASGVSSPQIPGSQSLITATSHI